MNRNMHWLTTALDGFLGFLPNLVAGLFILLLGYVISRVLSRVTHSILHRLGFDRLMTKLGIVSRKESDVASHWAGTAVFVVAMLATVMQVARTWNMSFVAAGFARLIEYAPHVLGAIVIFGASVILGNWVRDRLLRTPIMNEGDTRDGQMHLVPPGARGVIIAIGAFMALRELQIAPEIVNTAFSLTLGAIALAAALAFGLGGRDVAARLAQSWYDKRRGGPSLGAT
ncbi:MAG: mechanosensitive ion channel [Polyangiaceae bacterium]|nr:mechanosensitive ion channel [Polyangiaceae bacterium]